MEQVSRISFVQGVQLGLTTKVVKLAYAYTGLRKERERNPVASSYMHI